MSTLTKSEQELLQKHGSGSMSGAGFRSLFKKIKTIVQRAKRTKHPSKFLKGLAGYLPKGPASKVSALAGRVDKLGFGMCGGGQSGKRSFLKAVGKPKRNVFIPAVEQRLLMKGSGFFGRLFRGIKKVVKAIPKVVRKVRKGKLVSKALKTASSLGIPVPGRAFGLANQLGVGKKGGKKGGCCGKKGGQDLGQLQGHSSRFPLKAGEKEAKKYIKF